MDRLTGMLVFVKSVETGSLAGAARACNLSHATVSKHVRALEQSLGVRLLDLTTRRLGLTEAGRRYHDRCVGILAEVAAAALDASRFQSSPRGLLRVAAPAAFGELHLAAAIAEFMAQFPQVAVEAAFTDRFVSLVEGGFDVAVRIGRLPDSSLVLRRLGPCRMRTCAAPTYLDTFGAPAHPRELSGRACLVLDTASTPGVWWFQGPDGEDLEVRVDGRLRANSMGLLCRAAEQGLGIVFGPSFVLAPLVRDGRLRRLLDDFPSRSLDLCAVFPGKRHLSPKVRVFVDFLAGRFGGAPPWDEVG